MKKTVDEIVLSILGFIAKKEMLWFILDFLGERDRDEVHQGHGDFIGWRIGRYWISID